jgi:hypothetical protein
MVELRIRVPRKSLAPAFMNLFGVDPVALILLAAVVGVFVWVAVTREHLVEIVVKDGRVHSLRGVAIAQKGSLTNFFEHDVRPPGKLKVFGDRSRDGVLRISFRGRIDQGMQQQIRNYLKMVL